MVVTMTIVTWQSKSCCYNWCRMTLSGYNPWEKEFKEQFAFYSINKNEKLIPAIEVW